MASARGGREMLEAVDSVVARREALALILSQRQWKINATFIFTKGVVVVTQSSWKFGGVSFKFKSQ